MCKATQVSISVATVTSVDKVEKWAKGGQNGTDLGPWARSKPHVLPLYSKELNPLLALVCPH